MAAAQRRRTGRPWAALGFQPGAQCSPEPATHPATRQCCKLSLLQAQLHLPRRTARLQRQAHSPPSRPPGALPQLCHPPHASARARPPFAARRPAAAAGRRPPRAPSMTGARAPAAAWTRAAACWVRGPPRAAPAHTAAGTCGGECACECAFVWCGGVRGSGGSGLGGQGTGCRVHAHPTHRSKASGERGVLKRGTCGPPAAACVQYALYARTSASWAGPARWTASAAWRCR